MMINNREREELLNLINEFKVPNDNLYIRINNGKFVVGMVSSSKKDNNDIEKIYMYNHFLQSTRDVFVKTKLSLIYAIAYCEKINPKDFNFLNNDLNNDEFMCYYYLEDALYRVEMLWDALAQIYNLYSNKNIDSKNIYYKGFFKELYKEKKYKEIFNIKSIYKYLTEKESKDDISKGVHHYISNLRNVSTHRYSLSVTAISNNDKNGCHLRQAEPYLLYKICFDFNKVMYFVSEILERVVSESKETLDEYNKAFSSLYE